MVKRTLEDIFPNLPWDKLSSEQQTAVKNEFKF